MTELMTMSSRLAAALDSLPDGEHLFLCRFGASSFVSDEGSNRFVQFARYGEGIRAESVGNQYLEGADQLSPEDEQALAILGWFPPDEGGNHFREWDEAPPFVEIAELCLRTLWRIHGVEHVEQLDVSGARVSLLVLGVSEPTRLEQGEERWPELDLADDG